MSTLTSALTRFVRTGARTVRPLMSELVDTLATLVHRILTFIETWLVGGKHAQYGLAVTRILLGLTALGLLATNFRTRYYAFGSGSAWNGEAAQPLSDFPQIPLFSLFNRVALNDVSFTALYLLLAWLAILFTLGWRTKIVLPIFFVGWVSFIEMNDSLGDQGDNMFRITLLALLFADTAKRWSLDARRRADTAAQTGPWLLRAWRGAPLLPSWVTNLSHNLVLVAVTAHVCFVYASGALYKAGGAPWQHGYAIYNPLQTQRFGSWPELSDLITAWAPVVTIVSWSSIILQMCFPLMLLWRPTRIVGLFGITSFHIGIAVLMGLPWFSLAMIAIDAIFIRDATWRSVTDRIGRAWREAREDDESPPPRRKGTGQARERGPTRTPATERVTASG
ncbi:HTTM domain-containing protein [Ruania halotolerans]|uniref:HTTM domain-containing protein n=1 Tax=Ruania halotolerans TaxID=2897773 RepID=UPI001E648CCC|nr:HTTM domain-containing protein [Ruania halotolerans]UFU07220.1 HTTM domain-containing protein [Ruania halotolerans]